MNILMYLSYKALLRRGHWLYILIQFHIGYMPAFLMFLRRIRGRDFVVGLATRYDLDGPGFEPVGV
jgi:hypothetical protein